MTGLDLKLARKQRGWTQQNAARRLGLTQAYLSMLESGRRPVPDELAMRLAGLVEVSPNALPLEQNRSQDLAADLGALGYPGFAYLAGSKQRNPSALLLDALSRKQLDSRVAEGLPWLVYRFAALNWRWLVPRMKVCDGQNRLGFVVSLARELAERNNDRYQADQLKAVERRLERSRLVAEGGLGSELTEAERDWLRRHRSEQAKFWNVLTDIRVEHLDAPS